MTPCIRIRQLTVPLGRHGVGLNGVDATFDVGLHGLVGTGGAGKSTLLKTIAQVRRPAKGGVAFTMGDQPISAFAAKRLIGYAPQELALYKSMSVYRYLMYMGRLKAIPPAKAEAEARRTAGLLGLMPYLEELVSTLSIGQQHMVVLAQALMGKPRFLLLDEPFTGLDLHNRLELLEVLRDYAQQAVVIVCSHVVEEMSAADYRQIVRLEAGRVSAVLHCEEGWSTTAAEAFHQLR